MKSFFFLILSLGIVSVAFGQNGNGNPPTFWHEPIHIRNDSQPLKIVKDFFAAYQNSNTEKVSSFLADHISWEEPGDNRISGTKNSKDEVLHLLSDMTETSAGTVRIVDLRFFDNGGNSIGCLIHWRAAQPAGRSLDVQNIGVFTVENGEIKTVKIFSDNISAEDAFWGQD